MVLSGTVSIEESKVTAFSTANSRKPNDPDMRQRILDAAFALFTSRGYAHTSTLEIARQAKVSKRDLYALVGMKEDMLRTCIAERSTRLRWSEDLPPPQDRNDLIKSLDKFGYQVLREATDPVVISAFRLAIAEAERTPEIAQTLESVARATVRGAISELLVHAKAIGTVQGDPEEMTSRYTTLLWGDLMLALLLRSAKRPNDVAMKERASKATMEFMKLYSAD